MGNELSANPQPYKPRKPFRERFFSKVEMRDNGCWQWTAGKTSDGYGCFSVGGRRGGMKNAHAVAYEMLVGPVPEGKELDHTCRNRACVNPDHLEPVSHADNIRRGNWHGEVKLTPWQVAEVRRAYAAGGITQSKLASRFGVSQSRISQIVNDDVLIELIQELGLEKQP